MSSTYYSDTKTTVPYNAKESVHNLRYKYDPSYKRQVDTATWAAKDTPLQDTSLDLLVPISMVTRGLGAVLPRSQSTRLYHGTSNEAKKSIIDKGLGTTYTGEPGTLTSVALGKSKAGEASKGLAFTTESKWDAARYAASHDPKTGTRVDSASPIPAQIGKFGRQVKSYVTGDGIVTMDVPNSILRNEVLNPEFKAILEASKNPNDIPSKYKHLTTIPEPIRDTVTTTYGNIGFGADKVFNSNIPTKYIVGSKDYSSNTMGLGSAGLERDAYLVNKFGDMETANKVLSNKKAIDKSKRIVTHSIVNNLLENQ